MATRITTFGTFGKAGIGVGNTAVRSPITPLDIPQRSVEGVYAKGATTLEIVQQLVATVPCQPRGKPSTLPLSPIPYRGGKSSMSPTASTSTRIVLTASITTKRSATITAVIGT